MKVCPLLRLSANLSDELIQAECLGEKCALYVKIFKPSVDPTIQQTFEGCGLINTIPWAIKERCVGEKPKSVLSNHQTSEPNHVVLKKQLFSPFPETGSKPTPHASEGEQ